MRSLIEDYQPDPTKADPLDSQSQEFDWDEVSRRLSEPQHTEDNDYADMVEIVTRLFVWLTDGRQWKRRGGGQVLGLRLLGLIWTVNPTLLDGMSMKAISRTIGVSDAAIATHSADARRTFGVFNRAQQAHGWQNRKPSRQ